jgi:hypothetical protein
LSRSSIKNNLLVSTYLGTVTLVVFTLTGQIYGVNDDVIIQNWLSGLYTGSPEFMIRGSATPKMLFGVMVSNLYSLLPQFNWFSIILLGLTLASWYLVGIISIKTKNLIVIISYAIISFLHLLWFIPSPTYTASAVILSFSSIIYIAYSIKNQELNKIIFIPFCIYAFTYLVRPESFLLGSVTAGSFLIFALLSTKTEFRNTIRKTYVGAIFCLLIIGGDYAYEKYFYFENKDWATYKQWETARYKIQANAPEKAVSDNPSKYGWTQAEVELFKSYNYIDASNFTVNKFEKLIDDTGAVTVDLNVDFLKKSHQKIFDSDINWEWKGFIALISLFYGIFLLLSFPQARNYFLLTISSYAVLYFIMLYVAGFLRQPERVQVSVIFLAILISFVGFVFSSSKTSVNFSSPTMVLCGLLLIIVSFNTFSQSNYLISKIQKWSDSFWYSQIEYLSKYPTDSIFVGNASQFRNNWFSPYLVSDFEIENRIFTFGWHNFSPHWILRAQKLGLDPNNIFESVIDDPRVYWVSDSPTMEYIIQYMKESEFNFKGPEKVGTMSYFGDEYIVWNFDKND